MLSKAVLIVTQILTQVPSGPSDQASPVKPPAPGVPVQEVAPRTEERTLGGIAAIVGNKVITRAELKKQLDRRINEIVLRVKVSPAEINRRHEEKLILKQMIDGELVLQAGVALLPGRDLETGVPLGLVMSFIDDEIKSLQKTGYKQFTTREDYFAKHKSEFGNSREDVIRRVREKLLRNDYLYREVLPRIDRFISPAQSRAYYRSHRNKFSTPQEVVFQQIVLSADINLPVKIRQVNDGLAAGQSFSELAVKFSEEHQGNPRLRKSLHKEKWSELKHFQFPIPQALRALAKGKVSGPHRASSRVYFFRMEDVVTGKPKSYAEAQSDIESTLLNERQKIARSQDLKRLREATHVEIFLEATATSGAGKPGSQPASKSASKPAGKPAGKLGSKPVKPAKSSPAGSKETPAKPAPATGS
ncbi:MAG: peptidylprolyl isomerase [Planctomycetota bacterium]|nr:peptidylprolyl isomerase [Planctomycetota bacterium]